MRVGTIIAAGLIACLATGEAEAVTEGAAAGAALGPATNPAIADTLHRLNPQLVRALVHVFATLPESDPAFIAARARAGEIGAAIGLSGAAVEGLLRVLGDAPVRVEPIGEKLIQIAEAYDVAHARLVAVAAGDPAMREVADAEAALEGGQFDKAGEALKGETASAQIAAALGDVAMIRLRYADAAADYRRAVALTPGDRSDDKAGLMVREGAAAMRQADEAGDVIGFVTAADAYQAALGGLSREQKPLVWAAVESNLGDALLALGEGRDDAARLDDAVNAYRAALQELTRERSPVDWAATENNLGEALWKLGQQQSDPADLVAAVAALQAALTVRTPARTPAAWAASENILGNALRSLGEREEAPDHLVAAVAAYGAALEGEPRDQAPLDWAMTQNNLGNALAALGQREPGTARLGEAVTAFQAALTVRTRDEEPMPWAMTQNNLGSALETLGERAHDPKHLAAAVAAYDAALTVFNAAGAARYVEICTGNRARAAALLAKMTK